MRQRDLFFLIKRKLNASGIRHVVSYETAEQEYPYVWVDIHSWTLDQPLHPNAAKATVKLSLFSQYQGAKELTQMREIIVHALESDGQMMLVGQANPGKGEKRAQQLTLEFKAMIRRP